MMLTNHYAPSPIQSGNKLHLARAGCHIPVKTRLACTIFGLEPKSSHERKIHCFETDGNNHSSLGSDIHHGSPHPLLFVILKFLHVSRLAARKSPTCAI